MKKTIILFILFFPAMLIAQNNCDFFERAIFTIENTPFNSRGSDFGPSFVKNELWFSAFTDKEISKLTRGISKDIFYHLYVPAIDSQGNSSTEKQLILDKISKGYHAGPVSYCKTTRELFVTLSNVENIEIEDKVFQKAEVRLKIVVLKEMEGEWKLIEELPFNSAAYSVGHPAISITGDTLFFTAKIPDYGIGKTDLYLGIRKNGKWGKFENLGETINTTEDEMFPCIFNNNMLVFSTNGRADGKGGLDLYYSCILNGEFSTPQNIKALNSVSDDFGLAIHESKKTGYFTSKREGGKGDDDIYKLNIEILPLANVEVKVINDETEKAIPGALLVLSDCKEKELATAFSNTKGEFNFRVINENCFKLKASKDLYQEANKEISEGKNILRLKGKYDLELLVRDKTSLENLPNVNVRNNELLHKTDENGLIKLRLEPNSKYEITSEIKTYMNESIVIATKDEPFGILKKTLELEKVEVGQKFTLENIFYDLNKWDILPESEIELNKLVKIMHDNPDWKVELGSHTDSRGGDSYNKKLSQKRSDSAVEYIVSKGIRNDRIVAKGYGETQLINICKNGVNCTEDEHRQNRRTEFKILGM